MGGPRAIAEALVQSGVRQTFGEPVIYVIAGSPSSIRATFLEAFELIRTDADGMEVASVAPALRVVLADLPAAPERDHVWKVRGRTYFVESVEEDGHLGAVLIGRRA